VTDDNGLIFNKLTYLGGKTLQVGNKVKLPLNSQHQDQLTSVIITRFTTNLTQLPVGQVSLNVWNIFGHLS
jgi:hypothetical protein